MKVARFQILLCISILLVSLQVVSSVTTNTASHYLDQSEDTMQIQTGHWWDGSDLHILDNSKQMINACPAYQLQFSIKNKGFTMLGSTDYELYYSQANDPAKDGSIMDKSTLSSIKKNKNKTLTFSVEQPGNYQLKVDQRPMYEDKDTPNSVWSEIITVICEEKETTEQQNHDSSEQSKQEKPENISEEETNEINDKTDSETTKDQQSTPEQPKDKEEDSSEGTDTGETTTKEEQPTEKVKDQSQNNQTKEEESTETKEGDTNGTKKPKVSTQEKQESTDKENR
ncbi:hypothetical protein J416_00439 [Gracilibacillus halophilus YIM-C55.5]|uniref:Amyloid fiber anchoring/assembly protein TapA n=1 Tax=Gracilibacillus halophilus YIM-C55.5 TaxID=1308866 RepID=N4WGM8_9BACI|nr:amyloid fiber anchoring/assembly protein TapA [Gracilibacillus halophilus]ENH98409.1 hypothetical protein J416_00439 [Gracilibacillus halophilus YIM-C55.5]